MLWGMDEWFLMNLDLKKGSKRWKSYLFSESLFEANNFGDMKRRLWNNYVVARENPLMAVWNLWIDNWWLMDHASLASWWNPGSKIQPTAQRLFFLLHETPRKKKTAKEENGKIIYIYIHNIYIIFSWSSPFYEWVVHSISLPQKVCMCQGRQPLEVGTVCQAEWIRGKWWFKGWRESDDGDDIGWYYQMCKKRPDSWWFFVEMRFWFWDYFHLQ